MLMTAAVADDKNRDFEVMRQLETFSAIYKSLDMAYVDTLDPKTTVNAGIKGMLRALDPYTEYYAADEVKNLKTMITGKYAGIGAIIKQDLKINRVVIDEPYEGMPAAEVGLKKGDIVLAVNDSSMVGKTVSYVSEHLRGEPGTTFMLKVLRPTLKDGMVQMKNTTKDENVVGKVMKLKIRRRAIQMPAVPYYGLIGDNIGYLMLTQYTDDCARDVRRALVDMRQKGMQSLILDLRDNGGGSLQEALTIVNMFIPKGEKVLTTKGRLKRTNQDYLTTHEPLDTTMHVVVLVNGNTASASEITAGVLQDKDRAVIMGTRTFGKGLVQQPVDLPYNSSLKVTTSKYYIPSGRCIQAINYKHTGGGYKEHVPDSLTKEFKTRGGRIVRDGGGIKPDIVVKGDSLPNIAWYLSHNGIDSTEVMQYYVMDYVAKHPTIAKAEDFRLTDADFAEFKQQVIKSGFKYDRETSKVYDELVKMARFEGYYDDAKEEFEALKKKLQHNLERELDNNRKIITQLLEQDIVREYYFQRGGVANIIAYDTQIKKARELLKDNEQYEGLLKVGN